MALTADRFIRPRSPRLPGPAPYRALALALCLLLAACWGGERLYAAAESRPAIAPGDYRMNAEAAGAADALVRVSLLPDGMTLITPLGEEGDEPDEGDAITLGFAPLGTSGDRFVVWVTSIGGEGFSGGAQIYALMLAERTGFRLLLPRCQETRSWLPSFGVSVTPEVDSLCQLPDRARLEAALTRFAESGREGAIVATLVPR